jgi:hypothetical protein
MNIFNEFHISAGRLKDQADVEELQKIHRKK